VRVQEPAAASSPNNATAASPSPCCADETADDDASSIVSPCRLVQAPANADRGSVCPTRKSAITPAAIPAAARITRERKRRESDSHTEREPGRRAQANLFEIAS